MFTEIDSVEKEDYFKPIEVVENVRIARTCRNCVHCKGRINDLFDFYGYGKDGFYSDFYICALKGRETENCRLTEANAVCRHHRFEVGIRSRKPPKSLTHIEKCISEKRQKGE